MVSSLKTPIKKSSFILSCTNASMLLLRNFAFSKYPKLLTILEKNKKIAKDDLQIY